MNGEAGDEVKVLEKKKRGRLSLGTLTKHAPSMPNGVTFVSHSTHSLSCDTCEQSHKALSTLEQIPELWIEEKNNTRL